MFEKYSECGRRVVFFARLEAGRLGSESIEPEHLVLGLLTADQAELGSKMGPSLPAKGAGETSVEEKHLREPFLSGEAATNLRWILTESREQRPSKSSSMDMPLGKKALQVLLAAQKRAGNSKVDILDILWALLGDEQSFVTDQLKTNGVTIERVEEAIRNRERRGDNF